MTSYRCKKLGIRIDSVACPECPNPKGCEITLPKGIAAAQKEIKARDGLDLATFVPVFATLPRVPIVMAGVEYQLSTGPATFTPEDILDFVASQEDPAIVSPRLKIGHTSRLSDPKADGILKDGDDGVPALGKFINIGFDAETVTAYGDIAGVPLWLASMLRAGLLYPNRSIEGFQEALTVTGHTWGLVVQAVALLGVVWPGCSTLDDLPLLYTEDGPDDLEVYNEEGDLIEVGSAATAVAASGRSRPAAAGSPVSAAVNVDDVRRAYYTHLDSNQYWWWIRAIYIEPNELIVDDDEGQLYRVPFTINGDEVEFGEEQEVRIQYVDASIAANRAAIAATVSRGRVLASYESRAASRPETNQEGHMTPEQIRVLRARLGLSEQQLPDTATQAQLDACGITPQLCATLGISASPGQQDPSSPNNLPPAPGEPPGSVEDSPANPDAGGTPGTPNPDTSENTDTTTGPDSAPANASLPEGMIAVPAATWAQVQQNAQLAANHETAREEERRDTTIRAALTEGRIRPGDVPSYRNMHAAGGPSRNMFYQLLTKPVDQGGLAAGLVPTAERGEMPQGDASTVAGADGITGEAYEASWLTPQERARLDSIRAGQYTPPAVQSDDKLPAGSR